MKKILHLLLAWIMIIPLSVQANESDDGGLYSMSDANGYYGANYTYAPSCSFEIPSGVAVEKIRLQTVDTDASLRPAFSVGKDWNVVVAQSYDAEGGFTFTKDLFNNEGNALNYSASLSIPNKEGLLKYKYILYGAKDSILWTSSVVEKQIVQFPQMAVDGVRGAPNTWHSFYLTISDLGSFADKRMTLNVMHWNENMELQYKENESSEWTTLSGNDDTIDIDNLTLRSFKFQVMFTDDFTSKDINFNLYEHEKESYGGTCFAYCEVQKMFEASFSKEDLDGLKAIVDANPNCPALKRWWDAEGWKEQWNYDWNEKISVDWDMNQTPYRIIWLKINDMNGNNKGNGSEQDQNGVVTTVDLTPFTKLSLVDLWNNAIASITLPTNSEISTLGIGGNRLKNFILPEGTRLSTLSINSNAELTELNITEAQSTLQDLDISDCHKLTPITDFSGFTALEVLRLNGLDWPHLDVQQFANLREFYCNNSTIPLFDFTKEHNIQYYGAPKNTEYLDISASQTVTSISAWDANLSYSNFKPNSIINNVSDSHLKVGHPIEYEWGTGYVLFEGEADTVDLSSEAMVDGVATTFQWYKQEVNGSQYNAIDIPHIKDRPGVFVLTDLKEYEDYYCTLNNTQRPYFRNLQTGYLQVKADPMKFTIDSPNNGYFFKGDTEQFYIDIATGRTDEIGQIQICALSPNPKETFGFKINDKQYLEWGEDNTVSISEDRWNRYSEGLSTYVSLEVIDKEFKGNFEYKIRLLDKQGEILFEGETCVLTVVDRVEYSVDPYPINGRLNEPIEFTVTIRKAGDFKGKPVYLNIEQPYGLDDPSVMSFKHKKADGTLVDMPITNPDIPQAEHKAWIGIDNLQDSAVYTFQMTITEDIKDIKDKFICTYLSDEKESISHNYHHSFILSLSQPTEDFSSDDLNLLKSIVDAYKGNPHFEKEITEWWSNEGWRDGLENWNCPIGVRWNTTEVPYRIDGLRVNELFTPEYKFDLSTLNQLSILDLDRTKISIPDLSNFPLLEELILSAARIDTLDASKATKLKWIDSKFLNANLRFSNFISNGSIEQIRSSINIGDSDIIPAGYTADLSSEAVIKGKETTFRWFKNGQEVSIKPTSPGVFVLNNQHGDEFRCEMSNAALPNFRLSAWARTEGKPLPQFTWTGEELAEVRTYGDTSIHLKASFPTGTVAYTSSDTTVATINGNRLNIVGAGEAIIKAKASDERLDTIAHKLTVKKKDLTMTIDTAKWVMGREMPKLTYKINGFVNNDNINVLDHKPVLYTDSVVDGTKRGKFTIWLKKGDISDKNYIITFSTYSGLIYVYKLGDVNMDDKWDIIDINHIVGWWKEVPFTPSDSLAADANESNRFDVGDISTVVNTIQKGLEMKSASTVNLLAELEVKNRQVVLTHANGTVAAIELHFDLDSNLTPKFAGKAASYTSTSLAKGNRFKMMAYTMSSDYILSGEVLATLPEGAKLVEAILVNPSARNYQVRTKGGIVTGSETIHKGETSLYNYPNPVTDGETTIAYSLPNNMDKVQLIIYRADGSIAEVINTSTEAGKHTVSYQPKATTSLLYYRLVATKAGEVVINQVSTMLMK